jgi:CTP:molybdopterin cytidylyltransferase MocA
MKAMVLAAGLGTRLRPLTNDRPKALVEVGGRTLLEIALRRLQSFGVDEAIVNTHHYAEMVAEYLQAHRNFGMRIEISHEPELLDTGGGLKKAAWFFLEDPDAAFIVYNVDVLSTIDLGRMVEFHRANAALATLAVQDRASSRPLLFCLNGGLCGRAAGVEQVEPLRESMFCRRASLRCSMKKGLSRSLMGTFGFPRGARRSWASGPTARTGGTSADRKASPRRRPILPAERFRGPRSYLINVAPG